MKNVHQTEIGFAIVIDPPRGRGAADYIGSKAQVLRDDRYSLAGRALVARALGFEVPDLKVVREERLDMTSRPGTGAFLRVPSLVRATEDCLPAFTRIAFHMAGVALPSMLGDVDCGYGGDFHIEDFDLGDMIGIAPEGDVIEHAASTVYPDEERRWKLIEEAWSETFAFLVRNWSTVDAIAKHLETETFDTKRIPPFLSWEAPPVSKVKRARRSTASATA